MPTPSLLLPGLWAVVVLFLTVFAGLHGQEAAAPTETPKASEPATTSPEEAVPAATPKAPSGLPWEEKGKAPDATALLPVKGAKDILARYNVTESELTKFFAGEPLDADEEGVLLKILYHIPQFGLPWMESWRIKDLSLDNLALHAKDHQLDVIPLRGRVKHVSKKTLLPELLDQYEFTHYYVAEVNLDDSEYIAEIHARTIPSSWKLDTPMDESVGVDGLFLKVGGSHDDSTEPRLIFAAGRIRWYPDKESSELHIGTDQILLTKLGVDWGQYEDVKKSNRQGILESDRESFYQFLAAVSSDQGQKLSPSTRTVSVPTLLNTPQEVQGAIFPFQAVVRRITKVEVEDTDIKERFHIDHYYQLDCFLPLGERRLRLGDSPEDYVEYNNGFPSTLCVLELPPDLSPSENIREEIRVEAFFFKTWSFRSEYTAHLNIPQPAPMFVAFRPQAVLSEKSAFHPGDYIVGIAIALTCVIGAGLFFWGTRTPSSASAYRSGAQSTDNPDFSQLK